VGVGSFRDRINPDAIRFPGNLRIKILIVIGLAIDLACAAAVIVIGGRTTVQVFAGAVLFLSVAFKLFFWPKQIITDQFGLHSMGLIPGGATHIAWQDIGAVLPATEVPGFGNLVFGFRNDTLEFHSKDHSARVVHTPNHPDRDRLLLEVRHRGVTIEESALT